MMLRRFGLAALGGLLVLGLTGPADAARPSGRHLGHNGLELPGGRLDRGSRLTAWTTPPVHRRAAWDAFVAQHGPAWASWDEHTAVPSRIITSGIEARGTVDDPATALAFARALLTRHIDLLAPGAAASDFVLVTNELSHGVRSLGFVQHHRGREVVGGQVSFRFKHDALVVIGSEALPTVAIPERSIDADGDQATKRALAWLAEDGFDTPTVVGALHGPMVLPIVFGSGPIYREVYELEVQTTSPAGRWRVWIDAQTGEPVARRDLMLFGSAQLRLDVPARNPAGPRIQAGASRAEGTFSGAPIITNTTGNFDFAGAAGTLEPSLTGPLIDVINVEGAQAATSFPVADGAAVVWSEAGDPKRDGQLSTFVHTSLIKEYVRNIDPGFAFLDEQLPIRVNDDDMECNASWNGFSLNFFLPTDTCEHTSLLADVVYHEFGHAVHTEGLVGGVGFFDGALSEGVSDYLGATVTGDPGIGRGFFLNDTPLRQLDPDDYEWRWPEDRGQVHGEGRIIGGALWDLRKVMIDKLGQAQGVAYTDLLYYETHRRAVNIPSMYVEALLFDDDDGNLANGTPNACEINAAYGPHGLFSPGEDAVAVDLIDNEIVALTATLPAFPNCPVSALPTLDWRVRDQPGTGVSGIPMMSADGLWTAAIGPANEGDVIEYRVHPNFSTGTAGSMPDNFVDPWYQAYVGPVTEIYCLTDDAGNEWGFEGMGSWVRFADFFPDDPNDPSSDYDGDGVVIHQTGTYASNSETWARMPIIDTSDFSTVRLQFRRWLTVEDGFFDQAYIDVDGERIWANHESPEDYLATFHHTDREWRFVDFDISAQAADGAVEVTFGQRSDGGLEFGGWTLDEVCIVGVGDAADCGNGVLDPGETCDDGNRVEGDGCGPTCQTEGEGETGDPTGPATGGSGPSSGTGDGGGDTDGMGDTDGFDPGFSGDGLLDRGCACSSTGSSPADAGGLLMLGLLGWVRRRRAGPHLD